MKKIIIGIAAVFAVVIVAISVTENRNSKDRIKFVNEAENIEYTISSNYFRVSEKELIDRTADLMDTETNVIAFEQNEKIQFRLSHRPLKIYELGAEKTKVKYDSESNLYSLSPLYDAEQIEYTVVADYGIRKNVYTFKVYNKTYIENKFSQISAEGLCKSKHDKIAVNEAVSVKTSKDEYQLDSMDFRFIVNNNGNESLQCSMFKIEKMLGYTWYAVDENDISYNAKFWEESKQRMSPFIGKNGATTVKMPTSLGVLFELGIGNGLGSGTYRIVVPYICNGKTEYAISNPFTLGYVPSQTK